MLVVHRSERADHLVDALGELIGDPLPDPVVSEVVSVPTRGVERWLAQRLSHRLGSPGGDGVCANLTFPFPGSLLGEATARVSGLTPDEDPWRPERAVWPLVRLIDEHGGDLELAPLVEHLSAATPADERGAMSPLRRFAMARHIADLYDRYAIHRPDLVLEWAEPESPLPDRVTARWQAHLWRLLRQRIATPSPAERLGGAVEVLRAAPELLDLPARLSVFGLTRLPASHLEVLAAIAAGRDVHLFLLHPSAALWERTRSASPSPSRRLVRADDPTTRLAHHPLLRSWARDAREMQLVLASRGLSEGTHHPVRSRSEGSRSMLETLQADVRADRRPGSDGRVGFESTDTSIRVYACHGRTRQVEVLRDSILHLLCSDPDLEPRDVVVMCPDIEEFAPLVQAAFGVDPAGAEGTADTDPTRIRVRLADRSLRQTNPLLAVASQLLHLAGARVTASEILDLASRPAVARRLRFDREQLSTIERWIAGTGIRWGIDAGHRGPWNLERVRDNTWDFGLDRLMLGVAMADDDCRMFAGTVPYDDVPSTAVDLAGRFAELVDRVGASLQRLRGPQPVGAWVPRLIEATLSIAEAAPGEEWQGQQLRRTLAETVESLAGEGPVLTLEEVRALLAGRLQGRPTRANFRTGDLTICTLVPMRSVPHRVVALLGLDDGAFPRRLALDGDDLLDESPRVGDRDPRSEDRQLLLDALLAATDHLIVTYSGRDERTNRVRPPCTPVAELLDVLDATFDAGVDRRCRDHVVVEHPLQTFDERNFRPGGLGREGPWSFDPAALAGARSAAEQSPPGPWLAAPLPTLDEHVVALDSLVSFVQHPVRAFLRRRLNLYLSDPEQQLRDGLPLALDALERWGVGDRLLDSVMAGVDLETAVAAERRRGFLPPGAIADPVVDDVRAGVVELMARFVSSGLAAAGSESLEVRIEMPDGRLIVGSVPGIRGRSIVQCSYSRLGPKHRLAAWIRFLALNADRADDGYSALTLGRGAGRDPVGVARLDPPSGSAERRRAWCRERLAVVVDLHDRGMREPLPMSCRASAVWARGCSRGEGYDQLISRAAGEWESSDRFPGEQDDPEHVHVWGQWASLGRLLTLPPGDDETGPGWPEERSRFAVLARRLWDPILAHESLDRR